MTREEYSEIYLKKNEEIRRIKHELFIMKREYIEEHKQINHVPAKIHFIHQYLGWMKKSITDEGDGYIIGYDMIDGSNPQEFYNKVYPIIKQIKKDGDISSKEYKYSKIGILKFWEIGKEDVVYEIDFNI